MIIGKCIKNSHHNRSNTHRSLWIASKGIGEQCLPTSSSTVIKRRAEFRWFHYGPIDETRRQNFHTKHLLDIRVQLHFSSISWYAFGFCWSCTYILSHPRFSSKCALLHDILDRPDAVPSFSEDYAPLFPSSSSRCRCQMYFHFRFHWVAANASQWALLCCWCSSSQNLLGPAAFQMGTWGGWCAPDASLPVASHCNRECFSPTPVRSVNSTQKDISWKFNIMREYKKQQALLYLLGGDNVTPQFILKGTLGIC